MAKEQFSTDFKSYLRILSRRKWILVAAVLSVVAATATVTWRLTPIYEGTVWVEIQPTSASSSEAARALEAIVDPTRGLQTQVNLAKSESVLTLAANALGLPSTDVLQEALSVELLPDTQILELRVEHQRPDEARDWTNAMANAYLAFRRESIRDNASLERDDINAQIEAVEKRISEIDAQSQQDSSTAATLRTERDRALVRLTVLETGLNQLPDPERLERGGGRIISSSQLPSEPVRPNKILNLALSAILGSLLGLGLVFAAESLDDRLKMPEEVEERVGAPILGYVPLVKEWNESQRSRVAILSATASGAAEAYRTLKTNLRFVSLGKPLRTILVTSPVANAGKSTTAANLAATLAQGGSKVVLVSADLRRPSIHRIFGLTNSKGIVDLLDIGGGLGEALQAPDLPNLRILGTGGLPPNPTEILGSARFGRILLQLKEVADYVILDAPPVLGLGDSSALASRVDGILLVVRTGGVTKRELSHAVDQLRKAGGTIAGVVLNALEAEDGYGYYYHYYYTQYQDNSDVAAEVNEGQRGNGKTPMGKNAAELERSGEADSVPQPERNAATGPD